MCVRVCSCVWFNSETRRELEERTHEVLDMDSALKERQGELQQRAKVVQEHTHTSLTALFEFGFAEYKVRNKYFQILVLFKNLSFFSTSTSYLSWASWKWPSGSTSRRWQGRWSLCSRAWRPGRASWETHRGSSQTETPRSGVVTESGGTTCEKRVLTWTAFCFAVQE